MKYRIELLVILFFCGCSNISPNEGQIKKSLSNLSCYKELASKIMSDDELTTELRKIRDLKKRGKFEPITVAQEYRLMSMEELEKQLKTNWLSMCKNENGNEDDFRGVRLIDKNSVIIEIDEFDRYTLTETASNKRTVEFHRLIFSDKEVDRSKFYFGTEHQVWIDTIEENIIYEITQLKLLQ